MLAEIIRNLAVELLGDSARGRMARQLLRAIISDDDADIPHDPVRSLPRPPDGNVSQSSDSSARTPREHAPARAKPGLASDWPALRAQVKTAIATRGLSRRQAALEGGFNPDSFSKWLSSSSRPPGAAVQVLLRAWVEAPDDPPAEGPAAIEGEGDPLPATMLSGSEQGRLSGYLSAGLASDRDLRRQFQATRDLLEQAAGGEVLAAEIIGKVRQGLANGAG